MHLFYVTKPIHVVQYRRDGRSSAAYAVMPPAAMRPDAGTEPGSVSVRLAAADDGSLTAATLYIAEHRAFFERLAAFARAADPPVAVRLIPRVQHDNVLRQLGMPVRLGQGAETGRIEWSADRGPPRFAVINVFNPAFGDSIRAITVLRELRRTLAARFGAAELDLIQHPDNGETDDLYLRSGAVRAIHALPAPASLLHGYTGWFDLSGRQLREDIHWVDAVLELVGIKPATVLPERKRNRIVPDPRAARHILPVLHSLRARGRPLLYFHTQASTPIRSLPPDVAARFIDATLEQTDWLIVTTTPLPFSHPRVADVSAYCATFQALLQCIAHTDAFISVDTCVYHAADAFDLPGVILFTTILPSRRVAYYPYVESIMVGPANHRLWGVHFSGSAADVEYARELWQALEPQRVLKALAAAVARCAGRAKRVRAAPAGPGASSTDSSVRPKMVVRS